MLELALFGIVGTALIWAGAAWLEPAANQIARAYGLPRIVQGAILIAAASSFPELSSVALAAVRHGEFELGVASIVGSAIFNVLVIPAIAVFVHGDTITADRELIYKDAQFYFLAITVTFLAFTLAVVYEPIDPDAHTGTLTPLMALIPLGLYGIYLGIQYLDMRETDHAEADAHETAARALVGFVGGIVLILIGVEALLHAALELGDRFGTPSYLWGLTVVSIGTSLPDLLLSVRAIQGDRPVVSLSNVFGSNTFDLLVAVPIGALLVGGTSVNLARAVPMFAFLTAATVVAMAAMRSALSLSRREAVAMVGLYTVFLVWMLAEGVGMIRLL